jgi:hypothetical protein
MKRSSLVKPLLPLLLALGGCTQPKVAQGTVVNHDPRANVLIVRDELPPNHELSFAIGEAEIGATPEVGDVVRIAYLEEGASLRALRVMNVTRQQELRRD